jgi:hypothetical protein
MFSYQHHKYYFSSTINETYPNSLVLNPRLLGRIRNTALSRQRKPRVRSARYKMHLAVPPNQPSDLTLTSTIYLPQERHQKTRLSASRRTHNHINLSAAEQHLFVDVQSKVTPRWGRRARYLTSPGERGVAEPDRVRRRRVRLDDCGCVFFGIRIEELSLCKSDISVTRLHAR